MFHLKIGLDCFLDYCYPSFTRCAYNMGNTVFWPFNYRLAYQNIFVVDPIYTLPFLTFLIIVMTIKKENPRRSKFNTIGLSVSTSYLLLTIIFKYISFQKFEEGLLNHTHTHTHTHTRVCSNGYQALSSKRNTLVIFN